MMKPKAFLLFLYYSFFSGVLVSASPAADEATQVSLQLRWDHQFQFAGYYAADWQGFYEEEGLVVDIRGALTPEGAILSATREVAAGRADFGIGGADILLARDKGADLRVVSTIFQFSAARLYLKEETPYTSLADLLKLRVARNVGDLIDVEFQAMLKNEGIDPNLVTPYEHKPGLEAFLSDSVQVVPGYKTTLPFEEAALGIKLKDINPAAYGIDFYGDSIFTTGNLINRAPGIVGSFARASRKGWQYALDHSEEIAAEISDRFTRTDPVEDVLNFNRFQAGVIKELALYPLVEIGHINPYRWEKMNSLLKDLGFVSKTLDTQSFIFDPQRAKFMRDGKIRRVLTWTLIAIGFALVGVFGWIFVLRRTVGKKTADLRKSEERYREMAETVPGLVFQLIRHKNGSFSLPFLSGRIFEYTGNTPEKVMAEPEMFFKPVPPEDVDLINRSIEKSALTLDNFSLEHRLTSPDGVTRWFHVQSTPRKLDNGDILWNGLSTEITGKVLMEQALRDSEKLLRKIAANFPESYVALIEKDYSVSFASGQEFTKQHMDPSSFIGLSVTEAFTEEGKTVHEYCEKSFRGEETSFELFINDQYQFYKIIPLREADGGITRLLCVAQNITRQKNAELRLRKSEEKYRGFFEQSPIAVLLYDAEGNLVEPNASAVKIFGVESEKDIIGISLFDDPYLSSEIREYLTAGKTVKFESVIDFDTVRRLGFYTPSKTGKSYLDCVITPLKGSGYLVQIQDITERRDAEEALRDSERLLREITVNYPNSYLSIIEKDLTVGFTSGREFKKRNLDPESFVGLSLEQVFGTDAPFIREQYLKAFAGEENEFELFLNRQYQLYRVIPLKKDGGRIDRILSVAENITDRKNAEEELRKLNTTMERLARDSYHRVKNNLMVMEGLLYLQEDNIEDGAAKRLFAESRARLKTMLLIHEKLHKSADLNHFSFSSYLTDLLSRLLDAYNLNSMQVDLTTDIEDIELDADTATCCGLIINELISNTFKHAFRGRTEGRIFLSCKRDINGYTCVFKDDGPGIPGSVNLATVKSLGLELVRGFIGQINGTITLERTGGTTFIITFPSDNLSPALNEWM